MKKDEFINAIAMKCNESSSKPVVSKKLVSAVLRGMEDVIYDFFEEAKENDYFNVCEGVKVVVKTASARKAHDLRSGKMIEIPEHLVPSARFGTSVKESLKR